MVDARVGAALNMVTTETMQALLELRADTLPTMHTRIEELLDIVRTESAPLGDGGAHSEILYAKAVLIITVLTAMHEVMVGVHTDQRRAKQCH